MILKGLIAGTALVYCGFAAVLRANDLDYALSMVISLIVAIVLIVRGRLCVSRYDYAWMLCLLIAMFHVGWGLLGTRTEPIAVAQQALMFVVPLVGLGVQQIVRERPVDDRELAAGIVWILLLVAASMIPYWEELVGALMLRDERGRFHTYVSIAVIHLALGALLAGLFKIRTAMVVGALTVLFTLAAAHRSLYLALACQVAAFVPYLSRAARIRLVAAVPVALIGLGLTPSGTVMMQLFGDAIAGTDANTTFRLEHYARVVSGVMDAPFGYGFQNAFVLAQLDYAGSRYAVQHNSLLSYLYYLGWPGVLIGVFGVVYPLVRWHKDRVARVFQSALVGFTVFAIFNVVLEQPTYAFIYWVYFGVYVGMLAAAKRTVTRGDAVPWSSWSTSRRGVWASRSVSPLRPVGH
jgi:hypothetical protein